MTLRIYGPIIYLKLYIHFIYVLLAGFEKNFNRLLDILVSLLRRSLQARKVQEKTFLGGTESHQHGSDVIELSVMRHDQVTNHRNTYIF